LIGAGRFMARVCHNWRSWPPRRVWNPSPSARLPDGRRGACGA
jgi:hypothetical protein